MASAFFPSFRGKAKIKQTGKGLPTYVTGL
jgi:hypothetical protein